MVRCRCSIIECGAMSSFETEPKSRGPADGCCFRAQKKTIHVISTRTWDFPPPHVNGASATEYGQSGPYQSPAISYIPGGLPRVRCWKCGGVSKEGATVTAKNEECFAAGSGG